MGAPPAQAGVSQRVDGESSFKGIWRDSSSLVGQHFFDAQALGQKSKSRASDQQYERIFDLERAAVGGRVRGKCSRPPSMIERGQSGQEGAEGKSGNENRNGEW